MVKKKQFEWWVQIRTSNNLTPRIFCENIVNIVLLKKKKKKKEKRAIQKKNSQHVNLGSDGEYGFEYNKMRKKLCDKPD